MILMFLLSAAALHGVQMLPALPLSAATGGLSAAVVSTLLRPEAAFNPLFCQEHFDLHSDRIHWLSLLLGVVIGIFLAQILDILVIFRYFAYGYLKQRGWVSHQAAAVRNRLG